MKTITKLDKNYFVENLADRKLDLAYEDIKNMNLDLEDLEDINKIGNLKLNIMDTDSEMKKYFGIDPEDDRTTKLLMADVLDEDGVLGNFTSIFPIDGESGLNNLSELKYFVPGIFKALSDLNFSKDLKSFMAYRALNDRSNIINVNFKKNKKEKISINKTKGEIIEFPKGPLSTEKYNELAEEEKESQILKEISSNKELNGIFAKLLFTKYNKDTDIFNYLNNVFKAFGFLKNLEIMELRTQDVGKSESEQTELEKYIDFLLSNSLETIYLDYDVFGDDLVVKLILLDAYHFSPFFICRRYKDVFKGGTSNYPSYTEYKEVNLEGEKDLYTTEKLTYSERLKLSKNTKTVRYDFSGEVEHSPEITLFRSELSEGIIDGTVVDTIYYTYKTLNFLKVFSDFDSEIKEDISKLLYYLPEVGLGV